MASRVLGLVTCSRPINSLRSLEELSVALNACKPQIYNTLALPTSLNKCETWVIRE